MSTIQNGDTCRKSRSPKDREWERWLRAVISIAQQGLDAEESSHMRAAVEVLALCGQDALPELARQQRERGNWHDAMRDALWDSTPGRHPRDRWQQRLSQYLDHFEGGEGRRPM